MPSAVREGREARPAWLIPAVAAGFLAVVCVWVVAVPTTRPGATRPSAAPRIAQHATPPQAGTTTITPPPAAPSSPAADLDQAVPDSPPAGITWQLIDTVAVPQSDEAGPTNVTDGVPSGFAHTPTGALIAAIQISSRAVVESNGGAVIDADVADTAGKTRLLGQLQAVSALTPASPDPGTYLQLAGFCFVSYTPQITVVQVLNGPSTSGVYQVSTLTVAWSGTDWQLVVQPTGGLTPNQQIVSSPVGFVVWGGV